MNCLLTLDRVYETSRCFGFSTRSLGRVMFSFAGTAEEAGGGGRSGGGGGQLVCSRFIEQFPRRKTSRDHDF